MSIDANAGTPFSLEDEPVSEGQLSREERTRQLLLLGGAMSVNAMGYMKPVPPLLLDPFGDDEEEDPNP